MKNLAKGIIIGLGAAGVGVVAAKIIKDKKEKPVVIVEESKVKTSEERDDEFWNNITVLLIANFMLRVFSNVDIESETEDERTIEVFIKGLCVLGMIGAKIVKIERFVQIVRHLLFEGLKY